MTNPPVHQCLTKATTAEGDQMRYGPNWLFSRRGMLKVFDDRLVCGDWSIPFSEISEATLYSYQSSFFIPGYVLKVQTAQKTYHFGLNGSAYWKGDLPFPVKREKSNLGYSPFSVVVRVLAVVCLVYWLWSKFST